MRPPFCNKSLVRRLTDRFASPSGDYPVDARHAPIVQYFSNPGKLAGLRATRTIPSQGAFGTKPAKLAYIKPPDALRRNQWQKVHSGVGAQQQSVHIGNTVIISRASRVATVTLSPSPKGPLGPAQPGSRGRQPPACHRRSSANGPHVGPLAAFEVNIHLCLRPVAKGAQLVVL